MLLSAGWATASGLLDEFLFESVQNGFPKVTVSATGGKGRDKTNLPPVLWGGSLRGCQGHEREEGHTATRGQEGWKSEASWDLELHLGPV